MQAEKGSHQSGIKKIQLTADQVEFVSRKLPTRFTIVAFDKIIKQTKEHTSKSRNNKVIYLQQQNLSIDINKEIKGNNEGVKRERVKPVPIMQVQENNISKKIKITEEMVRPQLRLCWRILQSLKKHPSSWPFLQPVDPVALQIPTYFDIIKQPMDFGTIETNLGSGIYETQTQFHADVGKVFMNSCRFNPANTEYHLITKEIQQFYEKVVQDPNYPIPQKSKISINYPPTNNSIARKPSNKRAAQTQLSTNIDTKKKRPLQPQFTPMSVADKKNLGLNIRRLPRDALKGVWQIVNQGNIAPQQLKFDIDKLPVNKARQLQRYVNSQLQQNIKRETVSKQPTQSTQRQKSEASRDASSFLSQSDDDSF